MLCDVPMVPLLRVGLTVIYMALLLFAAQSPLIVFRLNHMLSVGDDGEQDEDTAPEILNQLLLSDDLCH